MRPWPGLLVALLVGAALSPWTVGVRPGRLVGGEPRRRAGAVLSRRGRRDARARRVPAVVDAAVVLDLAAAALAAGASVPGALMAVGDALGQDGAPVRRAGAVLLLGGSWSQAWLAAPGRLHVLAEALEPAWLDGVPAIAMLERAADRLRAGQARAAEEAAGRLGVRLVLPLGLCFLPAFALLGIVPVLLSAGVRLLG